MNRFAKKPGTASPGRFHPPSPGPVMSPEETLARLADGAFPVSASEANRAKFSPKRRERTSYGISAAEHNACLPASARDAVSINAVTRSPMDMDPDGMDARAFVAHEAVERKLVRKVGRDNSSDPRRLFRTFKTTATGERVLWSERNRILGGGAGLLRPLAEVSREIAARYPTMRLPTPHPFSVSEYADWNAVLDEAARLTALTQAQARPTTLRLDLSFLRPRAA
jgi:hypothetical protein